MASSSEEGLSVIRVVAVAGDFSDCNHLLLYSLTFSGPVNRLKIEVYLLSIYRWSMVFSGADGNNVSNNTYTSLFSYFLLDDDGLSYCCISKILWPTSFVIINELVAR